MKIAIVGAGIAGVTTSYELAALGHEVTIYERRGAAAEEGSFATAGLLSPACLLPWADPQASPRTLRRWLAERNAMQGEQRLSWSQWRWRVGARAASSPAAFAVHARQILALGRYSQKRQHALQQQFGLAHDQAEGVLVLLREPAQRDRALAMLPLLRECGNTAQELSPVQALGIEPALDPQQPLVGAIHLPEDGTGNCRQFALGLRKQAEALGARFEFETQVLPLDRAAPATLQTLHGARGAQTQRFDAVVVCAGAASATLLQPAGLKLPLRTVYGHSVSATFDEPMFAPQGGVWDEAAQIAITRLGRRVRVSAGRELRAQAPARDAATLRRLYQALQDWFPQAVRLGSRQLSVQEWKGAGAWLPDGRPVLGASGMPGVWLNLGHGEGGWPLACGSARIVADQVAGRIAEIDASGFALSRLQR